jgi:hypothetical protein
MTKTSAKKKSVSFKKVADNEISEFTKVKLFLENDIKETYDKYYESSINSFFDKKDDNFKDLMIKNENLRKDYERKKRALRIITSTHITWRNKTSIEGYFYRYYRDQIYCKSATPEIIKKIEL